MTYSYKLLKSKKLVDKCLTHSKKIFLKNLRTIKFTDNEISVLLKVNYGNGFVNEGIYENKKDLWLAFRAFTERE